MVEHTTAGLDATQAHGRVRGQPPALTPDGIAAARTLRAHSTNWPANTNAIDVPRSTTIRATTGR